MLFKNCAYQNNEQRPTKSAKLKRGPKTKGRKKKRAKSKTRDPSTIKKKVEVSHSYYPL